MGEGLLNGYRARNMNFKWLKQVWNIWRNMQSNDFIIQRESYLPISSFSNTVLNTFWVIFVGPQLVCFVINYKIKNIQLKIDFNWHQAFLLVISCFLSSFLPCQRFLRFWSLWRVIVGSGSWLFDIWEKCEQFLLDFLYRSPCPHHNTSDHTHFCYHKD